MHKSTYECQMIQLLLPEEAAKKLSKKMGRFALILSEVHVLGYFGGLDRFAALGPVVQS